MKEIKKPLTVSVATKFIEMYVNTHHRDQHAAAFKKSGNFRKLIKVCFGINISDVTLIAKPHE